MRVTKSLVIHVLSSVDYVSGFQLGNEREAT